MSEKLIIPNGSSTHPSDLERELGEHYAKPPANHDHWQGIDDQLALVRGDDFDPRHGNVIVPSGDDDRDSSRTLTEQEWREAVRNGVDKDTVRIRDTHQGMAEYAQWTDIEPLWKDLNDLRRYIRSPALDTDGARSIARLLVDIDANIRNGQDRGRSKPAYMIESLSPELLRKLYFEPAQEDGWSFAEQVGTMKNPALELRILESVYGNDKESLGYARDPVAMDVERHYDGDVFGKKIAMIPEMPRDGDMRSVAEHNDRVQSEMMGILREMGLADDLVDNYTASAVVRHASSFSEYNEWLGAAGAIPAGSIKKELTSIARLSQTMSSDTINRLHDKLGVENVWAYSDTELIDMADLLDRDPAAIEYFQQGDVTVEFIDARNDWNGALMEEDDAFKKVSGRTLRFEIQQPSDVYRRMVFLKNLGIKPSVFVYAAHGQPGKMRYSTGSITSYDTQSEQAVPIPRAQLGRMVRDFMQPNKSLNDTDPENIGRVQVVIASCSGDVPFKYNEKEYSSMADSVTKNIAQAGVEADIYAAPGVLYVGRDNKGRVTFNVHSDPDDDGSPLVQRASRLRTERRGGIIPGFPTKIIIHRAITQGVSARRTY